MEILNRKARFNYFIIEEIECGIELFGSEVKSIRNGNCNIKDSYGVIRNNEVYLINMFIKNYKEASIFNKEETRKRKLLLHKKEIIKLKARIAKLVADILRSEGMLNNPNFVAKAPAQKVEAEKNNVASYKEQLKEAEKVLKGLEK